MSESCSKCGATLGTYEYNRKGDELWCNTCTSGEVKQEVPKPKIKGEVSTIQYREETYNIQSIEPKYIYWWALIIFISFCSIIATTGLSIVVILFLPPLIVCIYNYFSLRSFHLKNNYLEVSMKHFDKKTIIDLKKVTQLKDGLSLIPTRSGPSIKYVTLYHNNNLLTQLDSYSIKNFEQLKEALFNTIFALNTDKTLEKQKGLRSNTYTIHDKATTIEDPVLHFTKNTRKRPAPSVEINPQSDTDTELFPNERYSRSSQEPYTPTTGLFCKEDEISYWDIYNE